MEIEKYEGTTCFYPSGAHCSIEKVSTIKLDIFFFFFFFFFYKPKNTFCIQTVLGQSLLSNFRYLFCSLSSSSQKMSTKTKNHSQSCCWSGEKKKKNNTREMWKMSRQWEVIIWSLWLRQSVDPREMPHSYVGATSRCLPSCRLSS